MRAGLRLVPLVLVWLQAPGLGAAEETARVVEVRAGRHPTFDRMVIELERDAPVLRLPRTSSEEMVLDLEARPLLPYQQLPTGFIRLQRVTLERVGDGMRIRVGGAGGPARAFVLHGPMRLVLDVADASVTEFEPPPGTERVPLLPLPGELPAEAPPIEPPPAEEISEERQPPRETIPEVGEGVVEPAPSAQPAPAIPIVRAIPSKRAIPSRPTGVERPPPEPPLTRTGGSALPRWLALLLWVGVPVLLGGLGFYLTRQRRSETPDDLPRTPESITPEEVLNASDRLDLLEKRIDEEVRSRVQLEDRMVEVQEDLKVVRDRVNRIARRGEASP